MAARKKAGTAFKAQTRDYDSLLLRSAESLGRMIGALQRQLDTVSKRLAASDGDGHRRGDGGDSDGDGMASGNGGPKTTRKTRKKTNAGGKVSAAARKQAQGRTSRKSTRPR